MGYHFDSFDIFGLIEGDFESLWILSVFDTTIGECMPLNFQRSEFLLDLS